MKRLFNLGDQQIEVNIIEVSFDLVKFYYNDTMYTVRNEGDVFSLDNSYFKAHVSDKLVSINGSDINLCPIVTQRSFASKVHKGDMLSPMPGKILKQCLNVGDTFSPGLS